MNTANENGNEGLLVAIFLLGEAAFGVDANQVQEVARVSEMTAVHHAPPFVIGIRNLRGRIVTIIDLRARLGLGKVAPSPENRVLIVELQGEPIGLLVDQVADTISTAKNQLQLPPPNLHGVQSRHVQGVIRGNDRLVALLQLQTVLEAEGEAAPRRAVEPALA